MQSRMGGAMSRCILVTRMMMMRSTSTLVPMVAAMMHQLRMKHMGLASKRTGKITNISLILIVDISIRFSR